METCLLDILKKEFDNVDYQIYKQCPDKYTECILIKSKIDLLSIILIFYIGEDNYNSRFDRVPEYLIDWNKFLKINLDIKDKIIVSKNKVKRYDLYSIDFNSKYDKYSISGKNLKIEDILIEIRSEIPNFTIDMDKKDLLRTLNTELIHYPVSHNKNDYPQFKVIKSLII